MTAASVPADAEDLANQNGSIVRTVAGQWPRLTERQWDLLEHLCDGATGRGMAQEFGLKTDSVSRTLAKVKVKLGARNQRHCIVRAVELGLLVVIDGQLQRNPECI